MCNITFNHSNYVIIGVITKSVFSAYILGILKVTVSYDLRHLELASPISDQTLQTHSLHHLQYGMRNVFSPFLRHFCYVILPRSHISVLCSTLRKLRGTYAADALCLQQQQQQHVTCCRQHGTKFLHLTVNCRLSDTAQTTEKGFLQVPSSSEVCIRHKT